MKQHEAVAYALASAGGIATLGYLYLNATRVEGVKWATKTPDASIRRIVQVHPNLFFRVKPGVWGLVEQKREILDRFGASASGKSDHTSEHVLYQGMLIELGNLYGHQTLVASGDKNRLYQGSPLIKITKLPQPLHFGYPKFVKKTDSIDVTWFNERDMPHSFFEVEHSTDIQNSLVKFTELQDFMVNFYIVADSRRESLFHRRLSQSLFAPIAGRVKFWNYDKVAKLHEAKSRLAVLESQ